MCRLYTIGRVLESRALLRRKSELACSCEVDISCFNCGGKGCSLCKHTGWIEVLGGGVVHPKVLENCGIDSSVYSGIAFGIGIERIAMLKYGINNIGLLFENDLRFLKQF